MKLTERDVEILRFINEFGFCEMPQIEKYFSLKKPRSYQVMQRLVKAEYVIHQRVFHARHGIFKLNNRGARYTNLPPLDKIPTGNYDYKLMIIDVSMKLRKVYPDANWISERSLIREKFKDGVGKRGHIADGILAFPDGKKIAIEILISLNNRDGIKRILKWYQSQFSIKEVWYYCSDEVIPTLSKLAAKMSFVKIRNLEEILL